MSPEYEAAAVDPLHPRDQLQPDQQNRLQGELPPAVGEQLLQVGPQQVQHLFTFNVLIISLHLFLFLFYHGVEFPAAAVEVNLGQGGVRPKPLVELKLQEQL